MAGPTSPGAEGPTYAPPQLPAGWIAQWDGSSRKYYFVQLSTGVSQWETPTEAAPTGGGTPAHGTEHPYGVPHPEVITHADGTQTVRHADGTMEPIMPPDGSRGGPGGNTGDRGFGSMAMNALLGGKNSGNSAGGHGGSNPLGLAGQLIGGITNSGGGQSSGQGGGKNPAGKLVGALASSLLSSGNSNKPQQPQNYHGGQTSSHQGQHSGGIAGAVMGGVASMFGGKPASSHGQNQNFGYSNTGSNGPYTGQAPPTSYQTSSSSTSHSQVNTPPSTSSASYTSPPNQSSATSYPPPPAQQHQNPSYGPPHGQHQQQTHAYGNIPPPPQGQAASSYGHGLPPSSHGQPQYGAQAAHGTGADLYGSQHTPSGQQHTYAPPPPPTGQHPQPSYVGGYSQTYPSQPSYSSPPPGGVPPQQNHGQGYGAPY